MSRLAGKVAFVTGAASGIGRATARLFAAEGARLVLADLDEAGLAPVAAETGEALALRLDVTSETDWDDAFAAALARHGRIDILVNSAGIAIKGSIEDASLADFRRTHAVNAEGTFLGCRAAVKAMKESGGGSIVNLSSVAGIIGDASSLAYCASKGAVRLMTKSIALHCARRGYAIRCNSVHPSFAETPMVQGMIDRASNPDRVRQGLAAASPMGRMGTPEEIAQLILFLASDESRFITGAEMTIDGGLTAQ